MLPAIGSAPSMWPPKRGGGGAHEIGTANFVFGGDSDFAFGGVLG